MMKINTSFQVYNASAGSGKTFSLVKEYLKIILKSDSFYTFQNILAVTFTNKAAGEMKERIVANLYSFSKEEETDMLQTICEDLQMDKKEIFQKSKNILTAILQNYAAFSITTIDAFTHKLIRTFAYDLGLSLNFDVEMDTGSLLQEAVDNVISKIGIDKALTQTLISYALRKAEDDKSWDISYELLNFGSLLLNENYVLQLQNLKEVTIEDFQDFKNKITQESKKNKAEFIRIGKEGLQLISDNQLEPSDLLRSSLPNHFKALITNPEKARFFDQTKLKETIEQQVFYRQSLPESTKNTIDKIVPKLTELYLASEKVYQQKIKNKLLLESLTPLAVLKYINEALETLKFDKNTMLNAEFNQIISKSIKNEPAPFIYERIGEKYRHYFIDEMQDTSSLQWQNMIPLLQNALTSEDEKGNTGSLLLVGDAKQSIYRWRGGKAEQFVALSSEKEEEESNPFLVPKKLQKLEVNYRSYSEIITFNNQFFTHISRFLSNPNYQQLFVEGNDQKNNHREGGYVQISFVEKDKEDEEKHLVFAKKVKEIIENIGDSFQRNEICVLVRSNNQGVEVADYLTQQGIQIISSETLLLNNSKYVQCIINVLEVFRDLESKSPKLKLLYFLHQHLSIKEPKHSFLQKHINLDIHTFFKSLQEQGISFSANEFLQLPFYESVAYVIQHLKLAPQPNAEIQFFLDVVFEYSQKQKASLMSFLDFWESKKGRLSVVTPEVENAVNIMTIHKSKGLEFPVVIYPYDLEIYKDRDSKVWYYFSDDDSPINPILLNYKKELAYIDEQGKRLYEQHREELELDNFNLLYVTMTRAVEQLYLIQEKKQTAKKEDNVKLSSGLFIHFLKAQNLWEDEKDTYCFGDITRKSNPKSKTVNSKKLNEFVNCSWKEHQVKIAESISFSEGSSRGKAIYYGKLLHEILSKIKTHKEVDFVVQQYHFKGILNQTESDTIKTIIQKIVAHPKLQNYFKESDKVYNEHKMIKSNGEILIPDRLCFTEEGVTIIDYKTGEENKEHLTQVNQYAEVLQEMDCQIHEKILVYIDMESEEITLNHF